MAGHVDGGSPLDALREESLLAAKRYAAARVREIVSELPAPTVEDVLRVLDQDARAHGPDLSGDRGGLGAGAQHLAQALEEWPTILRAARSRKFRLGELLNKRAHVIGFDGVTLYLEFYEKYWLDAFVKEGHEARLEQVLRGQKLNWSVSLSARDAEANNV